MSRISRLLDSTDLMSVAEAEGLFTAADLGTTELRAALNLLTQYTPRRRKSIFKSVMALRDISSSSSSSTSVSSSSSSSKSV